MRQNNQALMYAGDVAFGKGNTEEAIADYEKCVEMQEAPHIIDGLYSLAQVHEAMGNYEAAIYDNQRILEYLAADFEITDGEQVDSRKREMERLKAFLM